MNITDIRTCDLKPYENNPRLNEDAIDLVAASIDEFGFKQPIVVDKDLIIIAGHNDSGREEAHEIRSASDHETNSTDCKTDQEQQPNWRKRAGLIRRFRLHAYGLRTARTEVLHDGV